MQTDDSIGLAVTHNTPVYTPVPHTAIIQIARMRLQTTLYLKNIEFVYFWLQAFLWV
jgi:hypothetical protein